MFYFPNRKVQPIDGLVIVTGKTCDRLPAGDGLGIMKFGVFLNILCTAVDMPRFELISC